MEDQSMDLFPDFGAMLLQNGLPSSSVTCQSTADDTNMTLDWFSWSLAPQEPTSAPFLLYMEDQLLDGPQIVESNLVSCDPAAVLSSCDEQESLDSSLLDEIDIELEKYLIVLQMLGRQSTIDDALRGELDRLVGMYKSFQINCPQHCNKDCVFTNDARECCWNSKYFQSAPNRKKAFQLDVTRCVTEFLKSKGRRAQRIPLHCLASLREWTKRNYNHPYMNNPQAQDLAEELGLTLAQVKYWIDNWRAREWKPMPEGQTGRKGKYSHLPMQQTTKLREWIIANGRYPTKNEAMLLSHETNISEEQVLTWCCNFRKRNKELFRHWRGKAVSTKRIKLKPFIL